MELKSYKKVSYVPKIKKMIDDFLSNIRNIRMSKNIFFYFFLAFLGFWEQNVN